MRRNLSLVIILLFGVTGVVFNIELDTPLDEAAINKDFDRTGPFKVTKDRFSQIINDPKVGLFLM